MSEDETDRGDGFLVDIGSSAHRGAQLRMVTCPIPGCGAKYGTDYKKFASHVGRDHTPADIGLGTQPDRRVVR